MSAKTKPFTVLGLETSCDETAASIVSGLPPGPGDIRSNVVFGQIAAHRPYGGVVPEIAARSHVEMIDGVIARALDEAEVKPDEIDAVVATAGPGLIGGVMVGLVTAKALAMAWDKPLIAINHLEAHALTARLCAGTPFPFLLLLISGGHCQLMAAEGIGRYRLYGATIDDAVGEAFDKTAKLLGLPYPGGPEIEALAKKGDPRRYVLPRPMVGRPDADFSFSGLKTAARQIVKENPDAHAKADIAASFQRAVADILADRARIAMRLFRTEFEKENSNFNFIIAGGVAANSAIRTSLSVLARVEGFNLVIPPPPLCTDNGAMVAWAGLEYQALALTSPLDFSPQARWPLESMRKE